MIHSYFLDSSYSMKTIKSLLVSLFVIAGTINCFAQQLDGFKYVYVETCQYTGGGSDVWGISAQVRQAFADKGFSIISDMNLINSIKPHDSNTVLYCAIDHTNIIDGYNTVSLTLSDLTGNTVMVCSGKGIGLTRQSDYTKATRNALSKIVNMSYHYDPSKAPNVQVANVEHSDYTEPKIREYLDTATRLTAIEGIYKVIPNENSSHYRIGIIKDGDFYKGIILDSDIEAWKVGDVKVVFKKANMGLYSACWYMVNKTSFETFAQVDSRGIIKVDFSGRGEKDVRMLKLYPLTTASSGVESSDAPAYIPPAGQPKASGTGFIISKDGYIATNFHVIDDNNGIIVDCVRAGKLYHYNAEVATYDAKNDGAIIKRNESGFMPFKSMTYAMDMKIGIGADVFTIGYPLNAVMGTNYKVTNGIISAKTGINDDTRYYQMTVPIQPGNSGGPLLNSQGNIVGITSATLNEQVISTNVQNVNYSVKALYLLNAINNVPAIEELPEESTMSGMNLEQMVEVLKDYICLIKIF